MLPFRPSAGPPAPVLVPILLVLAFLVLALLPSGLAAQSGPREGQFVRVRQGPWIPAPYRDDDRAFLEGRFVFLSDDVLGLRLGDTREVRVPMSGEVPVELGREVGSHAREGVAWGTLAGLTLGSGLVVIRDDGEFGSTRGLLRLGFGVITGWTIGALYGSSIPKIRWTPLERDGGELEPLIRGEASGRVSLGLRIGVP